MPKKITVVGGANVDIGGFSKRALVRGDSNPGRVRMSAGGVGRNIAENCARMGLDVSLITAIGRDSSGDMLIRDCTQKNIAIGDSMITDAAGTSIYLFIDDANGDMDCAVNDMEIQAMLTPEFLSGKTDALNGADAVVLDANLPEESIRYIAEHCSAPIFADTVSTAKAEKLRSVLKYLHCLKVNRIEAELLTGLTVRTEQDTRSACEALLKAGVRNVFLTMGEHGAACAREGEYMRVTAVTNHVANATGGGDAFMAALVWAYAQGYDLKDSCAAGMAASMIAVESEETVSCNMTRENLIKRIQQIRQ